MPWSYFSECWVLRLCTLWNFPGQKTGVGSLSFLQRIFPTKESNPGLPHCRRILYQLSWVFTRSSPTCSCPWSHFLIKTKHCGVFFFSNFLFWSYDRVIGVYGEMYKKSRVSFPYPPSTIASCITIAKYQKQDIDIGIIHRINSNVTSLAHICVCAALYNFNTGVSFV